MGKKKDKRRKREREERERRIAAAAAAANAAPLPDPAFDEPLYADGAVEAEVLDAEFSAPPEPSGFDEAVAAASTALSDPADPLTALTLPRVDPRGDTTPAAPVSAAAREIIGRIAGATLCYGEPVRSGDRAVIPVARVRARGGMGFGTGGPAESGGGGGGGGGNLKAEPAGFIEVTPTGTTYSPVPRGRTSGLVGAAAVLAGAAAGVAGAALASRRRPAPGGVRGLARRITR